MATVPPYSMGIFETLVNVHFGEGLAVEFKPDGFPASHLHFAKMPAFLKAAFNVWFRVPLESVQAVAADVIRQQQLEDESDVVDGGVFGFYPSYVKPRMTGLIPIATWGPLASGFQVIRQDGPFSTYTGTFNTWDGSVWTATGTDGPFSYYTGNEYIKGQDIPLPPSGIYVEVRPQDDGTILTNLFVRIQMSNYITGEWLRTDTHNFISDYSISIDNGAPTHPAPYRSVLTFPYSPTGCLLVPEYPDGERREDYTPTDLTDFALRMNGPVAFETRRFHIDVDHWHNAEFSCDLDHAITARGRSIITAYTACPTPDCHYFDPGGGTVCAPQIHVVSDTGGPEVTGSVKAWLAIDDVDKPILDPNTSTPHTLTPTSTPAVGTHSSTETYSDAFSSFVIREVTRSQGGLPTWSYEPTPAPARPFGFPASQSTLSDTIQTVEMGEFHGYIGKTIDFSSSAKRRGFVDSNGKPVTSADATKKIIGVDPTVKLHGSSNWIAGKNTGRIKANFTPSGKIIRYKPDPSLRGPQSPSDLKK